MSFFGTRLQSAIISLCLSFVAACSTNPSADFDLQANHHQLQKHIVAGRYFDLAIYENAAPDTKQLHVYIGGDGKPWLNERYISIDPTTRRATTLALMALDTSAAIYLGRPCYHSKGKGRGCSDKWWTSHRYSQTVVNDMHYVLDQYLSAHNIQSLTLIGFSGGGSIAMLLAPLLKQTATVITISGNLDTDAWVRMHNYTPLSGSLNPARQAKLHKTIRKIHLIGMQDKNIPVHAIIDQFSQRANTQIIPYPSYTHHCCWRDVWPELLEEIAL